MSGHETVMYYNPSCSKCQYALEYLQSNGIEPKLIEYLAQVPSRDELKKILSALGLSPLDIIRKSEPLYLEKYSDKHFSNEEWLNILIENPVLLQRPILIRHDKAGIGRSEEQLRHFIGE